MKLFTKYAGAVAIAASLGATAFAVTPVQAQGLGFEVSPPGSNFNFGFSIGRPNRPDRPGRCISPRAIDDAIEDQGYRRVRITDYGRRITEARGTRGGWVYDLTVNSCSGNIIDRDRVRRS
jgi:hypothetical protein